MASPGGNRGTTIEGVVNAPIGDSFQAPYVYYIPTRPHSIRAHCLTASPVRPLDSVRLSSAASPVRHDSTYGCNAALQPQQAGSATGLPRAAPQRGRIGKCHYYTRGQLSVAMQSKVRESVVESRFVNFFSVCSQYS